MDNIPFVNPFNSGDTAFVALSAAIVFTMTPGVGIFYAGFFQRYHVIHTLMLTFACLPFVVLQWTFFGYSIIFSTGNSFWGDNTWAFLRNMGAMPNVYGDTIPPLVHSVFQMMFALVSSALIVGAIGNRMKLLHWIIFTILWQTFAYDVIARAVWAKDLDRSDKGFIAKLGALDFAGGLVVHVNAGVTALVASWVLADKNRSGFPEKAHNLPLTFIGFLMLWFGWMLFNGGSALKANLVAGYAIMNTCIAAAGGGAIIVFDLFNPLRDFTTSLSVGISGAVVGLVAITPAAGYVEPWAAIVIGFVSSLIVFLLGLLKHKMKARLWFLFENDSLDVFLCHGVGGILGSLLTGIFATDILNPENSLEIKGLVYSKSGKLLGIQLQSVLIVIAISAVVTLAILLPLKLVGLRLRPCSPLEGGEEQNDEGRYGSDAYEWGAEENRENIPLLYNQMNKKHTV